MIRFGLGKTLSGKLDVQILRTGEF